MEAPILKKYTKWDLIRLFYAGALVIYLIIVTLALILALLCADFNLEIAYIGVGFAVIGIAFTLVSAVMTDLEIRKVRDFSLYHEDIRREINLQAIEFKIRLDKIDERLENFTVHKNGAIKKTKNLTIGLVAKSIGGMLIFLIIMTIIEIKIFPNQSDIPVAIASGVVTGLFVIIFQKALLDAE